MRTQDAKHIRTGIMVARKCFVRYRETGDYSEYYKAVRRAYNNDLWHQISRDAFHATSEKLCKRAGIPFWQVSK